MDVYTTRGLHGLPQATVNVHITTVDVSAIFSSVVAWITRCLHDMKHTTDTSKPPQLRIGIFAHDCAEAWVCDGTPYIVVTTEQPKHITFVSQSNKLWLTHAKAIWCMDIADIDNIHSCYNIPHVRMCVLPCLLSTFYDGVPCPKAAPPPTTILHIGSASHSRVQTIQSIEMQLNSTAPHIQVRNYNKLFEEPQRSAAFHAAKVLVIPNFYAPPCMYTWHRIAYALRVRHPQMRIVAEECDGASIGWLLLYMLDPIVRIAAAPALARAAVAAALEEPWSEDECTEHATRIALFFEHVLSTPHIGRSWLPFVKNH